MQLTHLDTKKQELQKLPELLIDLENYLHNDLKNGGSTFYWKLRNWITEYAGYGDDEPFTKLQIKFNPSKENRKSLVGALKVLFPDYNVGNEDFSFGMTFFPTTDNRLLICTHHKVSPGEEDDQQRSYVFSYSAQRLRTSFDENGKPQSRVKTGIYTHPDGNINNSKILDVYKFMDFMELFLESFETAVDNNQVEIYGPHPLH